MRTQQEIQLKQMLNSALGLVKNATGFINSLQVDESSIKGLTSQQMEDLKKQTDLIKQNTTKIESEINKLTGNDIKRK